MLLSAFIWISVFTRYLGNTAFFFLPTMINKVSAPQLTIAADSHNARLFVLPVFGMFTSDMAPPVAIIPYWLK
jgi:hypothetical protein